MKISLIILYTITLTLLGSNSLFSQDELSPPGRKDSVDLKKIVDETKVPEDTLVTEPYTFKQIYYYPGVFFDYNLNFHEANILGIPFVPTCCKEKYGFETGSGISFGGIITREMNEDLRLGFRLFYTQRDVKLISYEKDVVAHKGSGFDATLIDFETILTADITSLVISPIVEYRLIDDLFFTAGPQFGILLSATATQEEHIISDEPVHYLDNYGKGKISEQFKGDIQETRSMHMSIDVGLKYEIRATKKIIVSPEVRYNYNFSNILSNADWIDENLYFGIVGQYEITQIPDDAKNDTDGDGLVDGYERHIGTDPLDKDTDNDGLMDGEEENEYITDPLDKDTDDDGLSDGDEVLVFKTDPLVVDTDGDSLGDGDEVNKYSTDPLDKDTDDDELEDGDEVNKYKTDPTKADTDGDGLQDGVELNKYKTDPLKKDTDGDGLNDGEEVNDHKTNPNMMDTDSDGLPDGDEVKLYKTDPLDKDTDDGSVNDGDEVNRGTNPLDDSDDIAKLKPAMDKRIVLKGITFETGSDVIRPESRSELENAKATLDDNPDLNVEIHGHTDNVGRRKLNMRLSKRRAVAVMKWMVDRGIDPSRMKALGFGPDKPLYPNDSDENKEKNRRIEFYRIDE